ncbi:Surface polysaccharide O-acyltransferase, integral membrane enzyme [Sporobacter termitidis DSM 10068]|uniref:Surface polysaccharide O-acyltransferase, integral membrane enzyme n=1 Tax=Sporobacter termitidis DSM 10068 TaxID=1123282 RepID=A0A1M5X6F0_9FIRM|nr:acyltransferase [Sporobacter termitidis]SHH95148.1 Surface polysaccharide O-acyltransferase, integral membrane enzyme [Sporobacter termitidis DSM 10068]
MVRTVKRLPEIAALNVMLCLLVVFIHVTSVPVTGYDKSSLQFAAVFFPWRFSGFVVPGFIFLSGLRMFLKGGNIDYGKFYLSRLKRIVLPYIAWNVIYYLYFILNGYVPFSLPALGLHLFRGDLVGPFYFIVVIVQLYALAPLWSLLVRKANVPAALLIAAALTFFLGQHLPGLLARIFPGAAFQYNDRVLTTYLFYWVAGCFAGANYERAKAWLLEQKKLVFIAFALVGLAEEIFSYISFSGLRYIGWLESLHFFYCVTAVFFFFTVLTYRYRNKDLTSRLAAGIDGAAYPIFLAHCLVLFVVNDVMARAGVGSITLAYAIRIAAVYTVTLGLCILWENAAAGIRRRRAANREKPALRV